MNYRSNITIRSNIYIKKSKSITDLGFIRHVRGYEALKTVGTNRSNLASWQLEELGHGSPQCIRDKSGTKSWGLVKENNKPVFVCKCEKTDCIASEKTNNNNNVIRWVERGSYAECSSYSNFKKIERNNDYDYKGTDKKEYVAPDFGLLKFLDTEEKEIYLRLIKPNDEKRTPAEGGSKPFISDKECQTNNISSKQSTEEKKLAIVPQVNKPTKEKSQLEIPITITYHIIDQPDEIIKPGIEEQIIINAGPGTGKTHSVIRRLGYIINNELAAPANILVLCYSRSAVGVIKNRIREGIIVGDISEEAYLLFDSIRTFDSFATYMLVDVVEEEKLNNLKYDERIEIFISELHNYKNAFDWLEYLIIDEIQDLVGVRARMVQAILEQLNCGFLLLGDTCQSIYDFQIRDEKEVNSYRFYRWLNKRFPDIKRFEFTNNKRQKEEIAMFSQYLRQAILSEQIEKQVDALAFCVKTLKDDNNLGNIRDIEQITFINNESILCRNNAEVAIISNELYSKGIKHRISKRAQHVDLAPWIAEVLSTYTERRIGRRAFKERVLATGYEDADSKWQLLKSVAVDDDENVLDIKLLVKTLAGSRDLPIELDLASTDELTVSTIHRAKGREYDGIYLISEDFNLENNIVEETKVAYVALTRGKEEIYFCSLPDEYNHSSGYFFKKYYKKVERPGNENRGRFYGYMWNPRKKNKYAFCTNFELGLDGDINQYSFVHKIFDAFEIQDRIKKLKIGDPLEAKYEDGHYYLYNSFDEVIGMLSSEVITDIRLAMEEQNPGFRYHKNYPKPLTLTEIYVNNIVTIANTRFNEVVAEPYNKSGLWLGVEISGFARTNW